MEVVKQILFLFILASFVLNLVSAERATYIVHMDKAFMPKAFVSHQHWYSNALDSLKSTSPNTDGRKPLEHLYTYDNVFHGFSAVLSKAELEAVKKLPGFVSACSDKVGTLDTTRSTEFLSLNPLTGLWPASDYGKDVIVGVLDTGVWPESPSYKDDGMTEIPSKWKGACDGGFDFNSSLCNKKLIGARYFHKGLLAANPEDKGKMFSARDTDGHGTHTSSTVAGNYVKDVSFFGYAKGTARGVAPRARLAIYKASFREGRYASDVLAALDQAVADGVDVISISLGFNSIPFYEDPIAIASFAAMEKGVFVSTSAGNSGSSPRRLHNGIPWVLTVAAGSMDRKFGGLITLGNGLTIKGWSLFPAKAVVKDSRLFYNATLASCNSTELLSEFPGGIGTVICDNSYSFDTQIFYVSQSNFQSAIFIASDYYYYDESSFEYPGAIISPDEAADVIKYASKSANPTVTIKFQQTFVETKPAPMVAEYTRLGPSPTYPGILKPDLMAPGTLVLAAWIPDDSVTQIVSNIGLSNSDDFNLISGTSMACPHAAGIAALLKGVHPEWTPAAIRSALVTTANPLDNTGNPIKFAGSNTIASPLLMGAGQVNPNSALDPGLVYDATAQDYIKLLCSINYTREQIHTITRSSYNCSKTSSDLNYPSFISLYPHGRTNASSQKFRRTLTNFGDGAASYKAKVTAPKGSEITVYPKKLVFGKKYDKQSYSLTIHYVVDENGPVPFGSITWVEDNGKHTVRSPIVIMPQYEPDD